MATQTRKKSTPKRRRSGAGDAAEPVDRIHAAALENARKQDEPPEQGIDLPEVDGKSEDYEPLLVLTTALGPRPRIEIDGEFYEIKLYREFGVADQHALQNDGEEYQKLWSKPALTKNEGKQLKLLLDRMYHKVLLAPPKIRDLLTDEQRGEVVSTFTVGPLQMALQKAAKLEALQKEKAEKEPETHELATSGT